MIGEIPEESENCHTILHTITSNMHELKRHDLLYFLAKLVSEQEASCQVMSGVHETNLSPFLFIYLGIKKGFSDYELETFGHLCHFTDHVSRCAKKKSKDDYRLIKTGYYGTH